MRLNYKIFIAIVANLVILLLSHGESIAKNIAILKSADIAPYNKAVESFKSTTSKNIAEFTLSFKKKRGFFLEDERKVNNYKLIFTLGAEALLFAIKNCPDTTILYSFVLYPNKVLDLHSEANPRVIGIDMNVSPRIQLETLIESYPEVKNVGVIYDPSKTGDLLAKAMEEAKTLNINLITQKVTKKRDAINKLSAIEDKIDALWMVPDTTVVSRESAEYMLLFSANKKIPLIGISEKYVKNGALFAYSFDINSMGRQAGEMAKNFIKNNKVDHKSSEMAKGFKLSMNLSIAKKLGLKIPSSLVKSADSIY